MEIKAIHTKRGRKPCIVTPRFFPKEVGMQFTVIKGTYKGSLFACTYDQFEFNKYAKMQIFFARFWYCIKMILWRKLRYQWPYRIRVMLNGKFFENWLPF